MKKLYIIGLVVLLTGCSLFKKDEVTRVAPTPTMITATSSPRDNVVPLYVEDLPFKTSWSVIASDGNGSQNAEFNKQTIDVLYPGENMAALSLYREGIPFTKGAKYSFSFDAESNIARSIQVVLSSDSGEVLLDQTLDINENKHFDFEVDVKSETTWNGKIAFNIGNDKKEATLGLHQVILSNILLTSQDIDTRNVRVNQVGYLTNSRKKIIFPYNVGDYYNVIDTKTNEVVYTGKIGREIVDEASKETTYVGDFLDLKKPGTYKIQAQIVSTSYEFVVEDSVYDNVLVDSLRMLSLQRCSDHLDASWAKVFSRDTCHNNEAIIYGTEEKMDASGGWHDAGDYGRYVKTGAKAASDLLLAYIINPQYFLDSNNVKESNNGIPDILDEIRWELEWLLKMQTSDGGVYNKVVSSSFAGYYAPEDDYSTLYVLPVSTSATGIFSGTLAMASRVFKDVDKAFSDRLLEASKKAYTYLSNNQDFVDPLNPEGFDAGEYRDDFDKDERFYAAMALWYATNEVEYLTYAKGLLDSDERVLLGLNWQTTGGYGEFLYLISDKAKEDDYYNKIYNHFMAQADQVINFSKNDGYYVSLGNNYNWGSNMDIANNGMLLMLADHVKPDDNYVEGAFDHLHYLLGRNSLNMSFLTGYGSKYPLYIHNRMVMAKGYELIGALVGGPNRNLEDDVVRGLFNSETPAAKVYTDNKMSYSTNEVAVYWNSAFLTLISALKR